MSADSEDEEDVLTAQKAVQSEPVTGFFQQAAKEAGSDVSRKRRLSRSVEFDSQTHHEISTDERKRLRLDDPSKSLSEVGTAPSKHASILPAEIWHYILTFCPPKSLGRLLQINKSFRSYIDPSAYENPITACPESMLKILTPDEIWRASRKLYLPTTPRPLIGKSELDMWKLACGTLCQFCGRKSTVNLRSVGDQWHHGPGENGVIPVWSFGIRSCGICLKEQSTKVGSFTPFYTLPTDAS